MKTITHDGKEYILKTDVDQVISERLSKYAERTRVADMRIQELEADIESKVKAVAQVDALNSQLAMMQDELNAANARYTQHSAIASVGITDPGVRDAVVWAYERAQAKLPKKDKVELSDWVQTFATDPAQAPGILRPHFQALQNQSSQPHTQPQNPNGNVDRAQVAQMGMQAPQAPPTTNNGVQAVPTPVGASDLLTRAGDPEFYKANREAIKEAWYRQRKGNY